MANYDHAARTQTLARIVGPYLVVMALVLIVRSADLPLLLPAFMQDDALVFATGAFTLMAGLTIVGLHHHWSSAAAIVITVIGIAAAIKGAMLMIAPTLGSEITAAVVRTQIVLWIAALIELAIGLWLSYAGWLTKP